MSKINVGFGTVLPHNWGDTSNLSVPTGVSGWCTLHPHVFFGKIILKNYQKGLHKSLTKGFKGGLAQKLFLPQYLNS